ncbi:MAG: metallophosphoesterase family protein [Planctomycetaceae bacterium]|nr:metallophosphoesterase family protein [Planctomycetaceae bacterium]
MSSTVCRILMVSAVIALTAAQLRAHDGPHPPQKVADADAHRPSPLPDRIILTWSQDPTTTQSVNWRTDATVAAAFAEIAEAGDGPLFRQVARRVAAETSLLATDLGDCHYHSVTFEGLVPETRYAYRVGDGENWSEWNQFLTASTQPHPFSFVYFGDAQNEVKSMWSRVIREAYRDAPRAAFLLHAGDLINHAHADAEWGEWHQAASHIHRMIPCIATPGNHEYDHLISDAGIELEKQLSTHWRPQFCLPENGPAGQEELAYWIDYQAARIISLNSNRDQAGQVPWLETVLANNPQRWTILTFHHPIYSAKENRDNPQLRELWQPIFDKYKVDIVLQGHDHSYARSKLMVGDQNVTAGTAARDDAGTVYVVSVSGPKMYEVSRRDFMARSAEDTQLYQIIHIDGDELRYEARTAVGKLYDAFTIKKRDGQANELIEQIPDVPENRREQKAAG